MSDSGRTSLEQRVVLCAREENQREPETLGLPGECLKAQPWLTLFSSAYDVRRHLRERGSDEVWIAGSAELDPLNLAAALKRDRKEIPIYLVGTEGTGSLLSRARMAGIDGVMDRREFGLHYARVKQERMALLEKVVVPTREDPFAHALSLHELDSMRPALELCQVDPRSRTGFIPVRNSIRFPTGDSQAFIMPVVSGSGGAGKSSVAVLAAMLCQRMGFRTLLLDLDLQFGDAQLLLGREDAMSIGDLISEPDRVSQLVSSAGGREPALLAAPRYLEQSEEIAANLGILIEGLATQFEAIVVNTGAWWTEQHVAILERSNRALFLVDQRPSSLRACSHAVELCMRCGMATGPFLYAVNRCSRNALYTSLDVSVALRGAETVELADGGIDVEEILATGHPEELIDAKNALVRSLWNVLIEIVPGAKERVAESEGKASTGRRLRGRRSRRGKRPQNEARWGEGSAACL